MKSGKSKRNTILRGRRWWWVLASTLTLLVIMPPVYYFLILDWQGRPYCHKQIMLGLRVWAQDNGMEARDGRNVFPNVRGLGKDSLKVIHEAMGGSVDWSQNYRYVPGLHEDDPRHLVLMYVAQPTRWTWHGSPPTIFTEKKWIVVPVDFNSVLGPGECSERIKAEDFKKRLRETIEFVRTNARPNWQTVVAEHTKFLESIEPPRR